MIDLGVILGYWCMRIDPRYIRLMRTHQKISLESILVMGAITGIVGARLLYSSLNNHEFNNFLDYFLIWDGGLSLLGAVIAIALFMPLFVRAYNIPAVALADIFTTYAPLIQACGRIGCFFAGCCYGSPTTLMWAVSSAYCPNPVHPVQLYSALLLLILTLCLYYMSMRSTRAGTITGIYLVGIGLERYSTDFWRADQEGFWGILSYQQLLALSIMGAGILWLCYIQHREQKNSGV